MDSAGQCSRKVVEREGSKDVKGDMLIRSNSRASINSIKDKHHENAKRVPSHHTTTATDVEDDEDKAAKVIQSNYRGHQERKRLEGEGKLPERRKKQEEQRNPQQQKQEVQVKNKNSIKEQLTEEMGNEEEDNKAAIVIQSNYRGHQERKRLQENKVPVKTEEIEVSGKEIQPQEEILASEDPDEERAATVIQSNFRGHKERKRLKEERKLDGKGEMTVLEEVTNSEESILQPTTKPIGSGEDEQQAAVKIQSNYRGFKERKQIQECTEREGEMFATFSKQITRHSEQFLIVQKKLNDVIVSHYLTSKDPNPQPVKKQPNGRPLSQYQPGPNKGRDQKQQRTPRRTQPPKTLNTPEDSTYYNLIHRSVQDGKRRPRKDSQVKLLDADDRYYRQITPASIKNGPKGSSVGDGARKWQLAFSLRKGFQIEYFMVKVVQVERKHAREINKHQILGPKLMALPPTATEICRYSSLGCAQCQFTLVLEWAGGENCREPPADVSGRPSGASDVPPTEMPDWCGRESAPTWGRTAVRRLV
uniref:myosin-IIIa n=1 Tax=Pristiophorus japonicus TaxID=55135 RepID=UPI00398E6F7F